MTYWVRFLVRFVLASNQFKKSWPLKINLIFGIFQATIKIALPLITYMNQLRNEGHQITIHLYFIPAPLAT
jgi:hypothetical protein